MLVLTRRINERIVVKVGGEIVEIYLVGTDGNKARIGFEASREVEILRKELFDQQFYDKEEK